MRAILDTNILVSALIVPTGAPSSLYQSWLTDRFVLISCEDQLEEFRRVTRYPRIRKYLRPSAAGTMLNEIRGLAALVGPLPKVHVCADPADNFLLAMAEAGDADYLVTGDGRHLLSLKRHRSTRIVTAKQAVEILG
jgi:putative PIN family toxin of toxin-antitoxin system